jgi:hypothetical protein
MSKSTRLANAARRQDMADRRAAVAALIELAQGYNATPAQIGQVAEQFGVEAWQVESDYFASEEQAAAE